MCARRYGGMFGRQRDEPEEEAGGGKKFLILSNKIFLSLSKNGFLFVMSSYKIIPSEYKSERWSALILSSCSGEI